MNIFLDANILFTAAYSPKGISHSLFDLSAFGQCSLITSAYAVDEARRNLALKASEALKVFEELLSAVTIVREPSPKTVVRMSKLPLVDKDAPILAAAVEAGVDILVTGDRRDFGHLYNTEVEGVLVLNPADTLNKVLEAFATHSS